MHILKQIFLLMLIDGGFDPHTERRAMREPLGGRNGISDEGHVSGA
jgi:hypothetical protein